MRRGVGGAGDDTSAGVLSHGGRDRRVIWGGVRPNHSVGLDDRAFRVERRLVDTAIEDFGVGAFLRRTD